MNLREYNNRITKDNPAPIGAGFFYVPFPYSWALFPKFTPQTNEFSS
jgi:hypothetical protein